MSTADGPEGKAGQNLEELLRSGRRHDCVDVEANDPLYVLHTSGTTGRKDTQLGAAVCA